MRALVSICGENGGDGFLPFVGVPERVHEPLGELRATIAGVP
ncbi:hypothetical protein [Arthrobacter sp. D2-10]